MSTRFKNMNSKICMNYVERISSKLAQQILHDFHYMSTRVQQKFSQACLKHFLWMLNGVSMNKIFRGVLDDV